MSLELKIDLARGCGFCFGVRNAIKKAEDILAESGRVNLLGDIVHNEIVVSGLSAKGARVIGCLDEADESPLLFRAHGTEKHIVEEARRRGILTVDATCPLVTLIHEDVKEFAEEDRQIIVIGDHGHEEVLGISSQVPGTIIVSSPEEVDSLPKYRRLGVVTQSTQMLENVQEIISRLLTKAQDIRIKNTICHPTTLNQTEVQRISRENDVVIIIGSMTSANTKRLLAVSLKNNERSYMITSPSDVKAEWFHHGERVGVTAGASTPDELINGTVEVIRNL